MHRHAVLLPVSPEVRRRAAMLGLGACISMHCIVARSRLPESRLPRGLGAVCIGALLFSRDYAAHLFLNIVDDDSRVSYARHDSCGTYALHATAVLIGF